MPLNAAARHSRYCCATSTSLAVVAPKLSSLRGASLGHDTTTSGSGFVSREGGIEALQLLSRMAAVSVNGVCLDLTLHLLLDGDVARLVGRDRGGRALHGQLAGVLNDLAFSRLLGKQLVFAQAEAVPNAAGS